MNLIIYLTIGIAIGYLLANIFKLSKIKKDTNELSSMRNASAQDILKDLGPQSKKEYKYYKKICTQ